MRLLDRYTLRQLAPVCLWLIVVFLFLSCLIDLFGHLDEILRYKLSGAVVLRYYAAFVPIVLVRAAPLAVLMGCAFVTMRLVRYQEVLAMQATGTSPLRMAVPFLFLGWAVCVAVFLVNELVIPRSNAVYELLREQAFRGQDRDDIVESVAMMDSFNRLYHARELDVPALELRDLTVLEHDQRNKPVKSTYASRAVWTRHGWLLLYGTIYRVGPTGQLQGHPQPFVERLITYPVEPADFLQPDAKPETMRFSQLRMLIARLRQIGIPESRRHRVELAIKLSLPFMSVILALLAFTGASRPQLRGNLRGLGASLASGALYFLIFAICQAATRRWPIPVSLGLWLPHAAAAAYCIQKLRHPKA